MGLKLRALLLGGLTFISFGVGASSFDRNFGTYEILSAPFAMKEPCVLKTAKIDRSGYGGYEGLTFQAEEKNEYCHHLHRFSISTSAPGYTCQESDHEVNCTDGRFRSIVTLEDQGDSTTRMTILNLDGEKREFYEWKLRKL